MSNVIFPSRWWKQPLFPARAESRVAPGMTGAWLLSPGSIITANLVTGETPTFPNAGVPDRHLGKPNRVGPVIGRNLDGVAVASRPILTSLASKLFGATTGSILLVARRNQDTGLNERGLWLAVTDPDGGIGIVPAGGLGGSVWQWQKRTAGPAGAQLNGGIFTNWTTEIYPQVYVVTAAAGALVAYQNGVQTASASRDNGTYDDSAWGLSGSNWDTFTHTKSSFYALGTWKYALPAGQVAELSRNPWEIFRPARRSIYVNAPAGEAPVVPRLRTIQSGLQW
jgi:hypothetical protein